MSMLFTNSGLWTAHECGNRPRLHASLLALLCDACVTQAAAARQCCTTGGLASAGQTGIQNLNFFSLPPAFSAALRFCAAAFAATMSAEHDREGNLWQHPRSNMSSSSTAGAYDSIRKPASNPATLQNAPTPKSSWPYLKSPRALPPRAAPPPAFRTARAARRRPAPPAPVGEDRYA